MAKKKQSSPKTAEKSTATIPDGVQHHGSPPLEPAEISAVFGGLIAYFASESENVDMALDKAKKTLKFAVAAYIKEKAKLQNG